MKKSLSILLVLLCMAVLFISCDHPESPEPELEPEHWEEPSWEGAQTISFWHLDKGDTYEAAWKQIADNFTAAHPEVTIEITCLENQEYKTKIATEGAKGHLPDIFRSWGGGVMIDQAEAGLLKDITKYTKSGNIAQMGKGAMSVYSYDGVVYGAPYSLGMVGLFYNKTVFKDAGLTEADFATWDKFLASCTKLKNKGYTPVSLGEKETFPGHYWWTYLAQRLGGGADFMNAYKGTNGGAFNKGSFLKAMEMLKDFVATAPFQDTFLDDGQMEQDRLVADREAAMTLMGQWAPSIGRGMAKNGYNDEWGLMTFPTVSGGAGFLSDVQGDGDGYIIGADASLAAVAFLKSLYEPENYKIIVEKLNACPVIPGYNNLLSNPVLGEVADAVRTADSYQLGYDQFLPDSVVWDIQQACKGIYDGSMTPQQACDMIQSSWEANK